MKESGLRTKMYILLTVLENLAYSLEYDHYYFVIFPNSTQDYRFAFTIPDLSYHLMRLVCITMLQHFPIFFLSSKGLHVRSNPCIGLLGRCRLN